MNNYTCDTYNNPKPIELDSSLSNIIFGYYVKYDRLKQLIDATFAGSTATEVDIYIDIKDILYKLNNHINRSGVTIKNPLLLTSSIINMIAHYRHFFATRYNCTTRFFLIDVCNELLSKQYYVGYSMPDLFSKTIALYNTNLNFLPMITQYIHNVQFIATCTNIVTKAISIYEIDKKNNPSIIISKDPYTLQSSMHSNFYVLVPKKNKNGDVSILSTPYSAVNNYIYLISKRYFDVGTRIRLDLLPLFMAMTKVPSKSLSSIIGIPSAIQKLIDISMTSNISYYPSDIQRFLEILLQDSAHKRHVSKIQYRYQACDAVNTLFKGYKLHPEYITYNGIVNLYDPDSIKVINNEHFKDCPLDLNAL